MEAREERAGRTRREERREETRAELIEAAARVFARRGLDGASVSEIAAEAGYSTGAIYWHFSGKNDLFLAVYEAFTANRTGEVGSVFERESSEPGLRARQAADQWMARVASDPELLVLSVELLIHAWRQPELREAFGLRRGALSLALTRILSEEADTIELDLPLPAEDLAVVLRELGTGLGLAKLIDPDSVRDDLFGDFVQLLFKLLAERSGGSSRQSGKKAGA